jgi:hypothetical protein
VLLKMRDGCTVICWRNNVACRGALVFSKYDAEDIRSREMIGLYFRNGVVSSSIGYCS